MASRNTYAAALNAKECYIFSDVDGVYTADPNKVGNAKKLSALSYNEMMEISSEGAKVLHNRCAEIGDKFKIPIITKSTFNNKAGTIITDKRAIEQIYDEFFPAILDESTPYFDGAG